MISRRNFIKAVFVSAGILAFPSVRLLEAASTPGIAVSPWFPRTDITNDIVGLFMSELSAYPTGSAAHSIANVEYLPCSFLGDDLNYYALFRGLSYGKVPQQAKYWAFALNGELFMQDMNFRRKLVDGLVQQVTSTWKHDGVAYWNRPWRAAA